MTELESFKQTCREVLRTGYSEAQTEEIITDMGNFLAVLVGTGISVDDDTPDNICEKVNDGLANLKTAILLERIEREKASARRRGIVPKPQK